MVGLVHVSMGGFWASSHLPARAMSKNTTGLVDSDSVGWAMAEDSDLRRRISWFVLEVRELPTVLIMRKI